MIPRPRHLRNLKISTKYLLLLRPCSLLPKYLLIHHTRMIQNDRLSIHHRHVHLNHLTIVLSLLCHSLPVHYHPSKKHHHLMKNSLCQEISRFPLALLSPLHLYAVIMHQMGGFPTYRSRSQHFRIDRESTMNWIK